MGPPRRGVPLVDGAAGHRDIRRRAGSRRVSKMLVVFRRELRSYFATPLAYVFIVIFLVLTGVFTFQVGGFVERGQADLQTFFRWHPWLYLVLIPAISMRLWAEERNSGSIELLMTLPITLWQAVVGKFLAAWCFAGIALLLTFPFWVTVNYLGSSISWLASCPRPSSTRSPR